ncbi:hypothetical protein ABFT80_23040 [Mesorhizobium sp. SB112]|uniref:hypothetical protein n=1 Tax=Mesorhizobium sp. SB112 TaxID=3151853 RepID=UPI0032645B46
MGVTPRCFARRRAAGSSSRRAEEAEELSRWYGVDEADHDYAGRDYVLNVEHEAFLECSLALLRRGTRDLDVVDAGMATVDQKFHRDGTEVFRPVAFPNSVTRD